MAQSPVSPTACGRIPAVRPRAGNQVRRVDGVDATATRASIGQDRPMLPLLVSQKERARELLPSAVFDYYASGAGDELTLREATEGWRRFRLRPRVLTDVSTVDLTTSLLGSALSCPIGVAP